MAWSRLLCTPSAAPQQTESLKAARPAPGWPQTTTPSRNVKCGLVSHLSPNHPAKPLNCCLKPLSLVIYHLVIDNTGQFLDLCAVNARCRMNGTETKPKSELGASKRRRGSPWGSDGKESACSPCVRKSPWRRKWPHTLQCSCLENTMDRGAWWATVHGVTKELDMTE